MPVVEMWNPYHWTARKFSPAEILRTGGREEKDLGIRNLVLVLVCWTVFLWIVHLLSLGACLPSCL